MILRLMVFCHALIRSVLFPLKKITGTAGENEAGELKQWWKTVTLDPYKSQQ